MSCDKALISSYTENLRKEAKDSLVQYNHYRGAHEYNGEV
jgi:hypothetical protein